MRRPHGLDRPLRGRNRRWPRNGHGRPRAEPVPLKYRAFRSRRPGGEARARVPCTALLRIAGSASHCSERATEFRTVRFRGMAPADKTFGVVAGSFKGRSKIGPFAAGGAPDALPQYRSGNSSPVCQALLPWRKSAAISTWRSSMCEPTDTTTGTAGTVSAGMCAVTSRLRSAHGLAGYRRHAGDDDLCRRPAPVVSHQELFQVSFRISPASKLLAAVVRQ